MTITRTNTNETYDASGVLVASEQVVVDITAPSIQFDLHNKARQRVADIDDVLATRVPAARNAVTTVRNSAPANLTQAVTELKRLAAVVDGMLDELVKSVRTESALIRLLINLDGAPDLLVETTDT